MDVSVEHLRSALISALGSVSEMPYIPPPYRGALDAEHPLVVGREASGKSFYADFLLSGSSRDLLAVKVYPPSTQVDLARLLRDGFEGHEIWRALVLMSLGIAVEKDPGQTCRHFRDVLDEVRDKPGIFDVLLKNFDLVLQRASQKLLLVFDNLETLAHDWPQTDRLLKALLQVVLELKPYPAIRAKVFVRESQFKRLSALSEIAELRANRIDLKWSPGHLYALLWHTVINDQRISREARAALFQSATGGEEPDISAIPSDNSLQGKLFQCLVGPLKGRLAEPHKWLPARLSDSRGFATPRSFLTALRVAAEHTDRCHPGYPWPVHPEGLNRGLAAASVQRTEDVMVRLPWTRPLLEVLSGLMLPCEKQEIIDRWLSLAPRPVPELFGQSLPPGRWQEGWTGVVEDLVDVGVFEILGDSRINVPEIYRLALHLGRCGAFVRRGCQAVTT